MVLRNLRHRTRRQNSQQGYLLLVIMIMVTLLAFAALAAAPGIVTQIKRDREEELVHRGAEYARAIKKYYKKFGRYPVSIEQLQNTNNIRFLRKRYKDPITGKDFRLLHFGEVKLTPKTPGAATGPGVAPAGGSSDDSTSPKGGQSSSFGSALQPSSGIFGSSGGIPGQTFGGGPIIGVTSTSEKRSLKAFNEKDHYNQWEFIYDPTMDRGALIRGPYVPSQVGLGGLAPGSAGGLNQSGFGQSPQSGFGQQPALTPFGQSPQQSPK